MAVALRDLERTRASQRPELRIVGHGPRPPRRPRAVYLVRRMAVLAVAIALVLGAVASLRAIRAGADATAATDRIEMTVVIPAGGTLWELAERYAPAGLDRSQWVLAVADRNDLDPGAILPGTPVSVPIDTERVTALPDASSAR